MGLGDAQIGEWERDRLGGHRRAAVGVDGQLVTADRLFGAGLADQHVGQLGGFTAGDHPADGVAREDIQDHVEVIPGPFRRAAQLGYVPRPHFVRPACDEFGLHLGRMGGVGTALPHLARPAQQPVERGLRAQVDTLVEQRGPHLGRGHVDEAVAVQHVEDRLPLGQAQRPRLGPVTVRERGGPLGCRASPVPPVVAGLGRADRDAALAHSDVCDEFGEGPVGHGVDLG